MHNAWYMVDALVELRRKIYNDEIGSNEDQTMIIISDVANSNKVSFDSIYPYFNKLSLMRYQLEQGGTYHSGKTIWTDAEKDIIMSYADEMNGVKKRGVIFEDLERILPERTKQAIAFTYYDIAKKNKEASNEEVSNEVKIETSKVNQSVDVSISDTNAEIQKPDILDVMQSLIGNMQQIKSVDLTDMLNGILGLSNLAVQNLKVNEDTEDKLKNAELKIEVLESSIEEKDKYIQSQNNKIMELKGEIDHLVSEFMKLREIVKEYGELNSVEKLSRIKEFNSRLIYTVDKFGEIVKVHQAS